MSNDLLFSILPRVNNTPATKLKSNVKKSSKNKSSDGLNDDERAEQKEVRKVSEKEQHLRHSNGYDENGNAQDDYIDNSEHEGDEQQQAKAHENQPADEQENSVDTNEEDQGKKGDNLDIYI